MFTTGAQSDLRHTFEVVMNSSNEGLLTLLRTAGVNTNDTDVEFMREIANYSINKLEDTHDLMSAEAAEQNRKFEADLFVSDRGLIEASVENLETVVCRGVSDLRSKVSQDLSPPSSIVPNMYRDEKQKLRALISHSSALSEFLDIPQYVELCISSGQYSEATVIFEWFESLLRDHPKLRSSEVISILSGQLRTIQQNFVASIEHRLSTDASLISVSEIDELLNILMMYNPEAHADAEVKLQARQGLFLMYRMNCFYVNKARILSVAAGVRSIKEYSELIRSSLPEIYNINQAMFGHNLCHPLTRFLVQEIKLFDTYLLRQIPDVYRRNGVSAVADLYSTVITTCEAVETIGLSTDSMSVFESSFVDVVVKERISKNCLETFKFEMNSYNWKPFTSLIPKDCSELDVLQLTRNRPIGVLYNEITTILNEIRIFPLKAKSDILIQAVDHLMVESFELILASVNNDGKSQIEFETMLRNFCTVVVLNIEVYLESLFSRKIELESVKSHNKFIFRSS